MITDHSYFMSHLPVHEGFAIIEKTVQASDGVTQQVTELGRQVLAAKDQH